jgi:DNA-binding response OmpR family regulator
MDIRMPIMNGMEAIKRIHEKFTTEQLPCVAITASTLEHQNKEVLDAGFDDFIAKPFHFNSVYNCLGKFLDAKFEYDETEIESEEKEKKIDFTKIILAKDIYTRLYDAADLNEITSCEEVVEILLKSKNEDEQQFAKIMSNYIEQYRFEEIVDILDKMKQS